MVCEPLARVAETEAVGGAAERQETTIGFDGADEPLEQFPDILLDCELFCRWEELDDEIDETLGEFSEESLLGRWATALLLGWDAVWVGVWLVNAVGTSGGLDGGSHELSGSVVVDKYGAC